MNEKTVGSWAFPGFLAGCTVVGLYYAYTFFGTQIWLLVIALLAVVLLAIAIAHLMEYVADYQATAFEMRQATLVRTSDSTLMLEARLLAAQSPELAGELARRVGRPDLILFPTRQGRRAQIARRHVEQGHAPGLALLGDRHQPAGGPRLQQGRIKGLSGHDRFVLAPRDAGRSQEHL